MSLIYVYDHAITQLGLIEQKTSFIWIPRYSSTGEFKLLVPFTKNYASLLVKKHLLMTVEEGAVNNHKELGEIKFVRIAMNAQGIEEIEVQGRFLSDWIGKRIVLNTITNTTSPQNILGQIVSENVTNPTNPSRRIEGISHAPTTAIQRASIDYTSESYINALLAVETLARSSALGFKITTDVINKTHTYHVYDGKDLTANNTQGNPPAIFSVEFNNILEQEFINSVENLRTTSYVGGEDRHDRPRRIVEVGASAKGLERSEVFTNATDIRQSYRDDNGNEIFVPAAVYDQLLTQRGLQVLEQLGEKIAFASRVNNNASLIYKKDYNIGDRVTCINQKWGVRIDVRITEVMEIHQDNNVPEIEITFGDNLPALIDQIRSLQSQYDH